MSDTIRNSDLDSPRKVELQMSVEVDKLVEAVCVVMGQLGPIAKSKGSLPYEFLSEDAVTSTLRPLLAAAGLVVFPRSCEVIEREDYATGKNNTEMTRFLTRHTWRMLHKSGQWLDGQTWGEASDSGDKCLNKCMTAAYKYFTREVFAINGGADPDTVGPDDVGRGARSRGPASQPNQNRGQQSNPNRNTAAGQGGRAAGNAAGSGQGNQTNQNRGQQTGQGNPQGTGLKPGSDAWAAQAVAQIENAADHAAVASVIDKARKVDWTADQKGRIKSAVATRRAGLWIAEIKGAPDLESVTAIQNAVGGALNEFPQLAGAVRVHATKRCEALTAAQDATHLPADRGGGMAGGASGGDDFDFGNSGAPYADTPVTEMEF